MLYLRKHYLFNSRRDLISKRNYKNINELSYIRFINLKFLDLKSKFIAVLGLCFFYFFLGLKGKVGFYSGKGLKKTMFCDLNLTRNKNIFSFLEKYFFIYSFNGLGVEERFNKKKLSVVGTFSFLIKDVLKFLELDESLFRFRGLKDLEVTFVFSSKVFDENLSLLKSFGFN